jgi:SWI/SNF-related matrix-associated actin-dependent regulator of chromatin subfamily D
LTSYLTNPTYAHDLKKITELNAQLGLLVQKIGNSKSKHAFFDQLSKNPTEFIARWLSSQKRDLEIIAGEGIRGGGEDVSADAWRRGGKNSIWATDHVIESVNLIVNPRNKLG